MPQNHPSTPFAPRTSAARKASDTHAPDRQAGPVPSWVHRKKARRGGVEERIRSRARARGGMQGASPNAIGAGPGKETRGEAAAAPFMPECGGRVDSMDGCVGFGSGGWWEVGGEEAPNAPGTGFDQQQTRALAPRFARPRSNTTIEPRPNFPLIQHTGPFLRVFLRGNQKCVRRWWVRRSLPLPALPRRRRSAGACVWWHVCRHERGGYGVIEARWEWKWEGVWGLWVCRGG